SYTRRAARRGASRDREIKRYGAVLSTRKFRSRSASAGELRQLPHTRARTSQETADVLLPGIATCRECHHSGPEGAEDRCFECHTYHDWHKEKSGPAKLALF
ncbi:MAG: hypothetical protein WA879_00785, partial [Candidatus Acidiferrales bacterium]